MILNPTQLSQLGETAKSAAVTAGQYIQSKFSGDVIKKHKIGGDSLASQVVTEVDFTAQKIILDHLNESIRAYDLGLLTEEIVDDQSRLQKDYFWCIDPLDGTLPFTEHRTGYAVSIALVSRAGDPMVGVVYIPDLKACYTACQGAGVQLNDQLLVRKPADKIVHFYMDRSFLEEPYYQWIKDQFQHWIKASSYVGIQYHSDLGGVRNALGVIESGAGCYFKFAKKVNGSGSIWDYAATCLFMQELGLPVFNAQGSTLDLNNPETTFMNPGGILYATDQVLVEFVIRLGNELDTMQ